MDNLKDLINPMRDEYDHCKWLLKFSITCNLLVVLFGVMETLKLSEGAVGFISISAFVLQIVAFSSREFSLRSYGLAEEIRRAALVHNGLGRSVSRLRYKNIVMRVRQKGTTRDAVLEPYYDSDLQQGSERLLAITAESSFYTHHIAKKSFQILFAGAVLCFGIFIVLILLLINSNVQSSTISMVTHSILPILSFWATGDMFGLALSFWNLHSATEKILASCEEIEHSREFDLLSVMILVDEYNCTLAASMPLPNKFYHSNKNKLNNSWSS